MSKNRFAQKVLKGHLSGPGFDLCGFNGMVGDSKGDFIKNHHCIERKVFFGEVK